MPTNDPGLLTLFTEALEQPNPTARNAYLDRVCGQNHELRQQLEELLAAHEGAGRFLEPDAQKTVDHTGTFLPNDRTGDFAENNSTQTVGSSALHRAKASTVELGSVIVGRYTLVEVIGEGGMGSVYLAEQTEPVKRQVALKLIKTGMDSKAVLARFDAERQALAMMDHPNIARIYDGGLTPPTHVGGSPVPFFVMELVHGVPLTEYCDTHRLTVDARLQLFVQVCKAVQHAHQKGIIHRDLKPGNVLVTEVDGRPTPKVIDFGVAKATEQKLTDQSFSDTGAIVGTPAYMSPEQADPTSMDIDTRSDVYALGVILYELLTGAPPIDAKQFKRGAILEMLRMVREVEAPRPSTKLSTADALPNIAANRSIDPAKLAKLLQGELDWVVMKALEKDRTRRYETANGLARDIQRYLADEVVEARPPSRGYRLKKFVKRNKGQVIAASLVLLTLVGGIVGTSLGLLEARHQRDAVDGERRVAVEQRVIAVAEKQRADESAESARKAAMRADTINDFLIKMLTQADPRNNPVGDKLTVRQLLDRAAIAVDNNTALTSQAEVEATIRNLLGIVYLQLGAYQQAEPLLRRALFLSRQLWTDDSPVTLDAASDLGSALRQLYRLDEATDLLKEVLSRRVRLFGSDHPKSISAENNLAIVLMNQGKWSEAESMFRSCYERIHRIPGFDEQEHLSIVANLAWVLESQENAPAKVIEAAKLLREHMSDFGRIWGDKSPQIYVVWDSLGTALRLLKEPVPASEWHRKALEGRRFTLGEDNDLTLASRNNLALALLAAGKFQDAEIIFRGLLATKSPTGIIELRRHYYLHNLALALRDQGRFGEAEPYMRESYEIFRKTLGPTRPETLTVVGGLLDLQFLRGGWADAEHVLLEVAPAVRNSKDTPLPIVAELRHRLGWVRLRLHKYAEAEADLRAGLEHREKFMPDSWSTFNTKSMLGGALLGQKKYAEAEPLLLKGYEGMKAREKTIPPQANPRLPEALDRLIELYSATNKPAETKRYRELRAKYPELAPMPRVVR